MDIKSLVFALWLVGSSAYIGLATPPKEQPEPARVREIMVEGNKEITKINGQIVATRELPKVEQPAPIVAEPTYQKQTDDEWEELIAKYFPADQVVNAIKVMRCESGVPDRVSKPNRNGTRDYGLMQINSIHAWRVGGDLNALLDPDTNIRVASEIYQDARNSWQPWTCKKVL